MKIDQHLHAMTMLLKDLTHIVKKEIDYIEKHQLDALKILQKHKEIIMEELFIENTWIQENKADFDATHSHNKEEMKDAIQNFLLFFQKYEKTLKAAQLFNTLQYQALLRALQIHTKEKGKYNAKGTKEKGDYKDLSFTIKAKA